MGDSKRLWVRVLYRLTTRMSYIGRRKEVGKGARRMKIFFHPQEYFDCREGSQVWGINQIRLLSGGLHFCVYLIIEHLTTQLRKLRRLYRTIQLNKFQIQKYTPGVCGFSCKLTHYKKKFQHKFIWMSVVLVCKHILYFQKILAGPNQLSQCPLFHQPVTSIFCKQRIIQDYDVDLPFFFPQPKYLP